MSCSFPESFESAPDQFCICLCLPISMAAQSPYSLPFAVLVSHLTSPSHSANMLLMFAACATWRFAAFPLFIPFSLMMPLKPFCVLLSCHVWITVILCLLVLQNTSLKNSRKFETMLLDSPSIVTPLLYSLHWLPVNMRIDYKISSLCLKVLESTVPFYFSDLLHVYTPSRQLRSSPDDRLFRVPHIRTKLYGQSSFAYQGVTHLDDDNDCYDDSSNYDDNDDDDIVIMKIVVLVLVIIVIVVMMI